MHSRETVTDGYLYLFQNKKLADNIVAVSVFLDRLFPCRN